MAWLLLELQAPGGPAIHRLPVDAHFRHAPACTTSPCRQLCAYHRYTGSWLTWEADHDFLAAGGLDGRLLGTSEVQDAIVATIDERCVAARGEHSAGY